MPSAPRVIVITGAASGIGRALALSFAEDQAGLVLSDRDAEGLAGTVRMARDAGGRILDSTVLDVTDVDAVKEWADRAVENFGAPDEVHHVAGIAIWGDARTFPHEKWKRVIDVNLMGTVHMVEAFVHHMTDQPQREDASARRAFVCVSSAAGIIGLPWHAAYSASKGGVIAMCEVLRFDLRPHGVDVHVVAPGAVDTPLVRSIDIHGVDRANPRVEKATKLFQRHAVTPEQTARAIRKGVTKGKFLITTSADIRFGRWAQVNIPWAYAGFMRLLNRGFRWASTDR
ncbi:short-chain dehydrogenase [Corynebacterium falsenii DSM 44353]|uniref:SDR family oxidoreductase n=1 Tax=Corynebacterium falsenii TaxID=108486 RepID=UPI0003E93BD0|nr:SDR family oxidoreductase [Corynebacterium falsenii]AHI03299.1 short-chain dehydrogenase [Corynebacterium falsenii DSM 44353]UBI03991.1 SDR family oxidoreductase [Corynebacterium falsenii]UBI05996.1 SDR family oxidoreductase [Corynebacterium falsenii]